MRMNRKKWIIRNRDNGAVLGIFHDARQGVLCVGGPLRFALSFLRASIVLPGIVESLEAAHARGTARFRVRIKCSALQMEDLLEMLIADNWETAGVRSFRRLMY
jgi:hypothetical protein